MSEKIVLIALILLFNNLQAFAGNEFAPREKSAKASFVKKQTKTVYQTENLIIKQISENVYQHISYFNSQTFGKVECNGMIVADKKEAVVFDTPTDDKSSAELIKWVEQKLQSKIKAVVPTHFHEDCVGGLKEFNKHKIPSYANSKTLKLAAERGFNVPTNGFENSLTLKVGKKKVYATFFGEGHTKDNIVGYFPAEKTLFGGCLIKELKAGKGNLEDANVREWSETVERVKKKYPKVKTVIPGHGNIGDSSLLDYTINLFKTS